MMAEKERLYKNIMEYDFALTEIVLYLDTHPTDKKALEIQKAVADKSKELTERYEKEFGPLTTSDTNHTNTWKWATEPWPWDN